MVTAKNLTKNNKEKYVNSQINSQKVITDPLFRVQDNIKAEYDMWAWIYQEVANLRLEVSRFASFVRINNSQSPAYLDAYHAHIYSLLIPVSVVIPTYLWNKIEGEWLRTKTEIIEYKKQRASIHNKKIPFKLIRSLDNLYRIALLAAQKAGLGFRVVFDTDVDRAIEDAVVGS